jgi:hypothetical protein
VEVLVVVVLMSFIILALMAVFNSTQSAFRSSITQTDVLEGGRSVMGLIKSDLESMTPSFGQTNGAVNFYMSYAPAGSLELQQSLPGSSGSQRTNITEAFFILTRQNRTWTGVGYVVDSCIVSNMTLIPTNFSLYRFSMSTNVMAADPVVLFNIFTDSARNRAFTNMTHLMDGVVDLRVRAYGTNGIWLNNNLWWITNGFGITATYTSGNIFFFFPMDVGESGFSMYSNTLPASVEVQLGVLEDRTLQRAESLNDGAKLNYLWNHAGQVHLFRQRVWIHNVDPSAYQ